MKNIRMYSKEWGDALWARVKSWLSNLDTRVTTLEQGGGGGDENVIESITLNGTDVPPDVNKNVALAESDPTVPSWAKQPTKPTYTATEVGAIPTTQKGAASGVAELDIQGFLPVERLPPNVRPNKIIALGETYNTAYRGDRGKAAYDHAQAKGSAYASGLYKIVTNSEGHVTGAVAVQKSDLTALGVADAADVPTKTSDLTNDSGFLTQHQDISGKKDTQTAVADPTASGTSLTFISSITQDAQGVITPAKKTVAAMTGATSGAAGASGLVPAPASGDHEKYLRGDGTWAVPSGGGGGDDLGFYIDQQGYICQRIGSDT